MNKGQALTYGALWRNAQDRLQAAGLDPAPHEGRTLVAHAAGLAVAEVWGQERDVVPDGLIAALDVLVARRLAGEPLAYVTGVAPFWKHDWDVGVGVLIPRPDSEVLVREVCAFLETVPATHAGSVVVDVGTGSGCLLGSVLQEYDFVEGVGVDISLDALACAAGNLTRLGIRDRCCLVQADVMRGLDVGGAAPDVVMSNPPYVAEAEWAALEPGVKNFEPKTALVGEIPNPDGLAFYPVLAKWAMACLAPGGLLAVEMGAAQGAAVQGILEAEGFEGVRVVQDLAGRDRVVVGVKPQKEGGK